jgi:hypothetical protein
MMLIAEKHGKILPEAQNHEDYLTSAVFGDLRYIPPRHFWQALFERTKASTPDEFPLTETVGHGIGDYTRLETLFWRSSQEHGEPDLILRFSGGELPALIVIVEVKLWSGKSGEHDQLARYLCLLDDLSSVNVAVAAGDLRYLIFLTPRESLAEIDESLATLADEARLRERIYRLQWQDVLEVAGEEAKQCEEPTATILADIAGFLRRRGLEYFDGFSSDDVFDISADDRGFYESASVLTGSFSGFGSVESLDSFPIQQGSWAE